MTLKPVQHALLMGALLGLSACGDSSSVDGFAAEPPTTP